MTCVHPRSARSRTSRTRIWFPGEVLISGTMPDKTPSGKSQSRCVMSTGYAAFSNFIGVLSGFRLSPPRPGEPPGNRPGSGRPRPLVGSGPPASGKALGEGRLPRGPNEFAGAAGTPEFTRSLSPVGITNESPFPNTGEPRKRLDGTTSPRCRQFELALTPRIAVQPQRTPVPTASPLVRKGTARLQGADPERLEKGPWKISAQRLL